MKARRQASAQQYFRNALDLGTNIIYELYWLYCRIRSSVRYTDDDRARGEAAAREGYAVLGTSDVTELACLAQERLSEVESVGGYASYPRARNSLLAPYMFKVLKEFSGPIEAHYRSHFRVNWFECQRITPAKVSGDGSFGYHTDDTPAPIRKVFIYLTDAFDRNGAFRAFDYDVTDQLIARGMLASAVPGAPRQGAQPLVDEETERKLNVLEGRKGTVLIFDNNLIHKGTLPIEGMRIHVSMEIMPSPAPVDLEDLLSGCNEDVKEYFPKNPFAGISKPLGLFSRIAVRCLNHPLLRGAAWSWFRRFAAPRSLDRCHGVVAGRRKGGLLRRPCMTGGRAGHAP